MQGFQLAWYYPTSSYILIALFRGLTRFELDRAPRLEKEPKTVSEARGSCIKSFRLPHITATLHIPNSSRQYTKFSRSCLDNSCSRYSSYHVRWDVSHLIAFIQHS